MSGFQNGLTFSNCACPLEERVGRRGVHVGDGHFGYKEDVTVVERQEGLQCCTQSLELPKVAAYLTVPFAAQENVALADNKVLSE